MVGREEGVGWEGGTWHSGDIVREGSPCAVWALGTRVGPFAAGLVAHVAIPAGSVSAFASSVEIGAFVVPRYRNC